MDADAGSGTSYFSSLFTKEIQYIFVTKLILLHWRLAAVTIVQDFSVFAVGKSTVVAASHSQRGCVMH